MKKTLQRLGIVTVGLSLCLWSCKEQDGLVKPSEATASVAPKIKEKVDFSVVEGRLKFETMEDFKAAVAKTATFKGIKEWEEKVGYTSMNEAYNEFIKQDVEGAKVSERIIDKEYDDVVIVENDKTGKKNYVMALPFPALAALVNQNGLVQIAGKVMKFSDEGVKIVDAQYKEELEISTISSHVVFNKFNKHQTDASKSSKVLANWDNDTYMSYGIPGGYSARRFRIRRMFHDINLGWEIGQNRFSYLFFCGVEVEHQRDDWNGWSSCNIDGWQWGPGSASLTSYSNNSNYFRDLEYAWPQSWGSSNGIEYQNTSTRFLGTAGFFHSNVGWGEYGIVASGYSSNMIGHTFGPQQIRDPNNYNYNTNSIFSFYTYR
jgi:hypothetical protein